MSDEIDTSTAQAIQKYAKRLEGQGVPTAAAFDLARNILRLWEKVRELENRLDGRQ